MLMYVPIVMYGLGLFIVIINTLFIFKNVCSIISPSIVTLDRLVSEIVLPEAMLYKNYIQCLLLLLWCVH